ncbi:MAG: hypothetical protein QOF13_475, partial [Solirubrobacterales bacterium]|nr:hypothetical protein [Solirubrobacterales bacterium]
MTGASGEGSLIAVAGIGWRLPGAAVEVSPERLAHELAWEALEDAGIPLGDPRGGRVGVFLGKGGDADPSVGASRVVRALGLDGPGLSLDTVESSSLVAVRAACESLLAGECEIALAGDLGPGLERPGIVTLKPLQEALLGGDPVYCAIRGTAVADPTDEADPERSGLGHAAIRYVELEDMVGIAGLIETARALEPAEGGRRVSSSVEQPLPSAIPWPISGCGEDALQFQAGQLVDYLEADPGVEPVELGFSLATGRTHLSHRAVCIGSSHDELLAQLSALAAGARDRGLGGRARASALPPVFVFPGQGGQWPGMARDLLFASPAFARHMEACEEAVEPFVDWSLREAVCEESGAWLGRLDVLQPALLLVTIALAQLWRDCGIEPAMVMGQSQGEIAAAHIAGGLSLDDAARLGALHSRISVPLTGHGGMVSVSLTAAEVAECLEEFGERVCLAGINGPSSVVVSGETGALEELLASWAAEGVSAQRIAVDYAAHSAQIETVKDEMLGAFAPISPRSAEIPFHSTVTGGVVDTKELGPEYWYRNLRQPVQLEPVVRALLEHGPHALIEIGPHPVLAFGLQETIDAVLGVDDESAVALGTLRRGEGGPARFAASVAEAHIAGVDVDWGAFFAGGPAPRLRLPARPLEPERHPRGDIPARSAGESAPSPGVGRLAAELEDLPESSRRETALAVVRAELASVLDLGSAAEIDANSNFKELGLESLDAVELRNRLRSATDVSLPTTAIFDHPTPAVLASLLVEKALGKTALPTSSGASVSARRDEPIAIVGMACQYPGGIDGPEALWEALREGRDLIGAFPDDRGWDLDRAFDSVPAADGAPRGGFLADAGGFDAEFFGISPREVLAMDPQQRLLLEVAWQALEGAGIDPDSLRASPTGVFAGISSQDYTAGLRATQPELDGYRLTGSFASVASGRIAYRLGLEGPAITVDTACSSSLVAIHLASKALQGGECSLALAGGATILGSPGLFAEFARQRGLSPDGRCKAFAEAADGVGFAEGVGLLVLERLSDAEAKGHRVLATIRASAVNQDGASNGLTAPNGPSQERVIRQALANARLKPSDVDVVEAHGTGTTLGDPIEANALLATYGQERERPLLLGSVKSNIGHTQAAAGVAGVIKAVLAMGEGMLPKTLHVDAPSSKVDWEAGQIELVTEATEWKADGRPRRAGVSSFGASGTNAHLILEEAPVGGRDPDPGASTKDDEPTGRPLPGPLPFLLSARSPEALAASAERLGAHLRAHPEAELTDLSLSLATTRAQLERRAALLASDPKELQSALAALAAGAPSPHLHTARASSGRLAFLFTGQGSQRAGMGQELYESCPAYAEALDQACEQLDRHLDRPLKQLLFAKPGSEEAALLDHTTYAQPALFATELALYRLLGSFGLKAELLGGHSVGEIVAAHLAGVFDLPDAARLICARGALMGELPEGGAMLAIEATEAQALASIEGREELVSLAAVNAPNATVISGAAEAIAEIEAHWQAQGAKTKRLAVSHAFHSPLIEPMLEPFSKVLAEISFEAPALALLSNTSGELLSAEQATDPAYWVAQAREPVRFAQGIQTLSAQGATTYIELGPEAVLCAMAAATLQGEDEQPPALIATLREGRGEAECIVSAMARAHAHGAEPDWEAFFAGSGAKPVSLPTYPFQRRRFWLDSQGGSDPAAIGLEAAEHPLLGAAIADPEGGELTLSGRLSLQTHPWLADHAIGDMVLLPGTAFMELALEAAARAGCEEVAELLLPAPLILPETGGVALRVKVGAPTEDGEREISIHSRPEGTEGSEWSCNARGVLAERASQPAEPLAQWPPPGAEPLDAASLYGRLAEAGFDYGPAFQGLQGAWRVGKEIYAEVSLAPEQATEAERWAIHPALLDAAFHAALLGSLKDGEEAGAALPFAWERIAVGEVGADSLRVRIAFEGESASFDLAGPDGRPLGRIGSLRMRPLPPEALQGQARPREDLLALNWKEVPAGEGEARAKLVPLAELERGDAPGGEEDRIGDGTAEAAADVAAAAQATAAAALEVVQQWLAQEPEPEQTPILALLTRNAAAAAGEDPDLAGAAVWGLLRSAQAEHPGRFALIDTDGSKASEEALPAALAACAEEPQLALREGRLLAPRIGPPVQGGSLVAPLGPWVLDAPTRGTLDGLSLVPAPMAEEPLGPSQVRIAVHAAGLNFRDVMSVLGVYPGEAAIGGEGAGTVVEVGPEVSDLEVGERVLGMIPGAFGPLAVAERELLIRLPEGWSLEQGAALPLVSLTAHYGLIDLAELKAGERILVHAGAGGVGMAAIQLARHRGAEVYATASPAKWEALGELGVASDHIASSRDIEFEERFLEQTGGEGVDVVLNSLAGEFVDASLALLPRGGRFLEMGKTDVRDPETVAAEHPGVAYRAFDLGEAGTERMGEILGEIAALIEAGEIAPAPTSSWDVRQAPEAFRHLREGRNVGKVVLEIPRALDPGRTVLISGGTGGLGGLIARHLVEPHGARHLLLASRGGPEAEGAAELLAELQALGASVRIEACDVSERAQLEALLGSIDPEYPLGAVIHTAGALDDGTIDSMDAERLGRVFAPKARGAWHLHELTAGMGLSAFVLFSS